MEPQSTTNGKLELSVIGDKNNFERLLTSDKFREFLSQVATAHLTPEKVCKMASIAASRQPRIFECTVNSVFLSIVKSAELGLDCTGTLGQGFLVPFYNGKISKMECQFIPGYQGLITLARRSGNIDSIECRPVFVGDDFELNFGSLQPIKHKPCLDSKHRGELKLVYAQAWMKDTVRPVVEWMTREEIDAIRDRSKSRDRNGNLVGPWVSDYVEMARKTVIRRLAKYLPLSPEFITAIEADNQQYEAVNSMAVDIKQAAGVQGLKDTLRKQVNTASVPVVEQSTSELSPIPEDTEKKEVDWDAAIKSLDEKV